MNLLDLVKSWGVWKAGDKKLEKLGKPGWAADGPQMRLLPRCLVIQREDLFLGQRSGYGLFLTQPPQSRRGTQNTLTIYRFSG
jgi:hypothetical protein